MTKLTHIDEQGNANMVDVTQKPTTERKARANAYVYMNQQAFELIVSNGHKKGDVLGIAQIAGIQAAKKTSDLIPLCHPLMLTSINVYLTPIKEKSCIQIESVCKLAGQTGVEMEALTAVSVAALTLYDMCKAVDKSMRIEGIQLLEKRGGKSGTYKLDSASD